MIFRQINVEHISSAANRPRITANRDGGEGARSPARVVNEGPVGAGPLIKKGSADERCGAAGPAHHDIINNIMTSCGRLCQEKEHEKPN